ALAFTLFASTAAADTRAPIATADWSTFIGESYSRYRDAGDPLTFEDRLFAAGEHGGMDAAIARFARELHVSDATARAVARVLVESVKHRESCLAERCAFAPGSALYDLAAGTGMAEPTGGLLASVGMNLNGATGGVPNSVAFIRLISAHPAASAILAAVYR